MKYLSIVVWVAAGMSAANLGGCANQDGSSGSAIYRRAVPTEVSNRVGSQLAELSRGFPLSEQAAESLRTSVRKLNVKYADAEVERAVERAGFGGIPAIAQLLNSADGGLRVKALRSLSYLVSIKAPEREGWPVASVAIVLLARRSLLDVNTEVRRYALAVLSNVGAVVRRGKVMDEIKEGLREALSDPDPQVRRSAQRELDTECAPRM